MKVLKDSWPNRAQGFAWAFRAFLLAFFLSTTGFAEDFFRWDKKLNRVSASFKDWPIEKVLIQIATATGWDVRTPVDSEVAISGTFKNLVPAAALKRLFGHLNYAVFSSPKSGKPRLQVFLPGVESVKVALPALKPKTVSTNRPLPLPLPRAPLNSKTRLDDIIKRSDKNGDGKLDAEEKKAAIKAMRLPPNSP